MLSKALTAIIFKPRHRRRCCQCQIKVTVSVDVSCLYHLPYRRRYCTGGKIRHSIVFIPDQVIRLTGKCGDNIAITVLIQVCDIDIQWLAAFSDKLMPGKPAVAIILVPGNFPAIEFGGYQIGIAITVNITCVHRARAAGSC